MPAYLLFNGLCATLGLLFGPTERMKDKATIVVWMRPAPTGSYIRMFRPPVGGAVQEGVGGMVLLGVCVTGVGLWAFKNPTPAQVSRSLSVHWSGYRLLATVPAPSLSHAQPWRSWTNLLKLYASLQLNASFYTVPPLVTVALHSTGYWLRQPPRG